ncbi:hypothetical protein [Micromonospora vulcania]|uniref:Uncharacterized protein n=1 Tax=Micromonospora vulcania TaxID=1441873 RepID=A0ABW1H9M2_9ACTN
MRGDLDETLARLARREEARRRRTTDRDDTAPLPAPADQTARPGTGRTDTRNVGPARHDPRHAGRETPGEMAGWGPVEAVAEAVREVVSAHPELAVTVRAEYDGRTYPLRIFWDGTDVRIGPEPPPAPVAPPPSWPLSGRTVPAWVPGPGGLTPDPAARLAELIRRDPSLLNELDPRR